jgi:DnaJ-class molecular chaperone
MTTHYDTLGVAETATADEIKAAYKKLAKQYHPDLNPGNAEAEARFKEVSAAHDILKDAARRAAYDHERSQPPHQEFEFNFRSGDGFGFGFPPDDMFRQMQEELLRRQMNRDVHLGHTITLEDAFHGFEKETSYRVAGEGLKTIRLKIPAGIEHGNRVRFAGAGIRQDITRAAGDLYVTVGIQAHPVFRRDGKDLVTQAKVDALDAMLGCEVELQGIDGQGLTLAVPAGVQTGQMLRLKGQGMPVMKSPERGDLFVEVFVTVPRGLSEQQKQLLRRVKAGEPAIHA